MTTLRPLRVHLFFIGLALLFSCSAAFATTVRLPKDEDLVAGARAIVRGRVLSVFSAFDNERIFTYTTLRVHQIYKGKLKSKRIVIKEEGGMVGSLGSMIWGMAQFAPGEEVLVYLTTRSDGSFRVHDMFLGKFNIIEEAGVPIAVRQPIDENVRVLQSQTNHSETTERMELNAYVALIRDKITATRERFEQFEENWFANTPLRAKPLEYDAVLARGNIEPQFTFIRPSQPSRWFEPDDNQPVVFTINPDGAPNPQIIDDMNAAMNAWSTITGSTLRVVNGGTTTECYPHGVGNTMVFNNCDNRFTPDEGCSSIIAIGGVNWDNSITRVVNGVRFAKIYQGHITFNPYSACSYDNHCNVQEIATHELGHALGLGHSADITATMAGTAHFDGRCASIRSDDADAMRFIYPVAGGGGSALRVFTETLPDGVIANYYEQDLLAGGGVTPFTWSLVSGSGALPQGFVFLPSGRLRGTPIIAGTSTFTIQVRDAVNATAQRAFTLTIGTEQTQYASQFIAQNVPTSVPAGQTFTANIRWTNTGTRVWDGLNGCRLVSMNPANNTTWGGDSVELLGFTIAPNQPLDLGFTARAPQSAGTYNFQWQLYQEGVGVFGQPSVNVQITVTGEVTPPTITSPSLLEATVGAPFNHTLQATGGTTPYNWAIASGALPSGLTLNGATGVIAGSPTTAGSSTFTVQLRDAQERNAQRAITITVTTPAPPPIPPLDITTASLPGVTINTSYNAQLAATGGSSPYTWAIASGALPNGLTLNATSGSITGTATTPGNFLFTVRVTDTASRTAQKPLAITVNPPPLEIITTSLSSAVVRAAYSVQLTATGGASPYTWFVATGALPDGLTLNAATASITGTPLKAGIFTFTVEVRDAQTRSARRDFAINVANQPLAIDRATANFEVTRNAAFAYSVNATGGAAPYVWALTSGAMSLGLTLNTTTGLITGAPTVSGTFNFVIAVRDQRNETVTSAIQLKVIDPSSIPLITKATYKSGKRMLQVYGERFDPTATLLIDGALILKAKFSDGILIVKKLSLAPGRHQLTVMNPNSIPSQPFFITLE